MSGETNFRCGKCGYEMLFEITYSPVEVSLIVGCPGCGSMMDRKDALGDIERSARGDADPADFTETMKARDDVLWMPPADAERPE